MKKTIIIILNFILLGGLVGCIEPKNEIIFADAGWDSIQFHNAVAGLIAVEAFGYDGYRELRGTTPVTHEGIIQGDIDVHMEEWTDNIPTYKQDVDDYLLVELGVNFDDNYQGLYVPRYVIEGDQVRGIKPMAPDLKTVEDLKKYPHVFVDDEKPHKGRIYGAIPGWEVDEILYRKYKYLGLDEDYIYFRPGSDAALSAVLSDAYLTKKPIVGYFWQPTWLLGMYDFVLLEDYPFTTIEDFQAGKTEMPSMEIKIAVSNNFYQKDPTFCEFLNKYNSNSTLISEALAYTQLNKVEYSATAKWFLNKYDYLLDEWLTPNQAQLVRKALGE